MTDNPEIDLDLVQATQDLTKRVTALSKSLDVSKEVMTKTDKQLERNKTLIRWLLLFVIISFAGIGYCVLLTNKVDNAVSVNKKNAVINCQNANDSREATRTLWTFLFDASTATNTGESTPEQVALVQSFILWVNEVYATRDCSDLSKKYDIPDPPTIPQG